MRRAIGSLICFGLLLAATTLAAHAEKRVALVIGNGAYANATQLPNPKNDAEDVAAALKRDGFETIVGIDLDQAKMQDTAIAFARAAREADVALFYYSGHAMQFGGVNYLMPVDAELSDEADLRRMARVDDILADLQQAKNLRILVLDACRDNPFAEQLKRSIGLTRAASLQRGLARIDTPQGMIVAFSTQAQHTAEDGSGRNSPYTVAFLKHIEEPGEIGLLFRRISTDVYEATEHKQLPELSLSMIGEYYLRGEAAPSPSAAAPSIAPEPAPTLAQPAADPALDAWNAAKDTDSVAVLDAFVTRYGDTFYGTLARAKRDELSQKEEQAKVAAVPPAPEPVDPTQPQPVVPSELPEPQQLSPEPQIAAKRREYDAAHEQLISHFERMRSASTKVPAGVYGHTCIHPGEDSFGGANTSALLYREMFWAEGDTFYRAVVAHPERLLTYRIRPYKSISLVGEGSIRFYKMQSLGEVGDEILGFKNGKAFYPKTGTNDTKFGIMERCGSLEGERSEIEGRWPKFVNDMVEYESKQSSQ